MDNQKLCYTVEEAAQILGVSRSAMYNLVHAEGFPVVKLGIRRILVSKAGLEQWINDGGLNSLQ